MISVGPGGLREAGEGGEPEQWVLGLCLSARLQRAPCPCARALCSCLAAQADPCETNPCLHGGTCQANGTVYSCSCDQGFTGENCEIGEWPLPHNHGPALQSQEGLRTAARPITSGAGVWALSRQFKSSQGQAWHLMAFAWSLQRCHAGDGSAVPMGID